jgi:hypothetical protein
MGPALLHINEIRGGRSCAARRTPARRAELTRVSSDQPCLPVLELKNETLSMTSPSRHPVRHRHAEGTADPPEDAVANTVHQRSLRASIHA